MLCKDIISEFFLPCLTNCIQYDRAIEFTTMKSLSTLSLGFENSGKNSTKIRMITGHLGITGQREDAPGGSGKPLALENEQEAAFLGGYER